MQQSLIRLLPNSKYSSVKKLIQHHQDQYPPDYSYRPISLELEITNKCNLICAGCGQRDETHRPLDVLKKEDFPKILLQANHELPLVGYSITGGEPLLYLETVLDIISQAAGLIDLYKLNSNGYRFINPESTKDILLSLKQAGFGRLISNLVSLLVSSIGQQNEAGVSIQNAVNLASSFYSVFDQQTAICTFNATDKSLPKAHAWLEQFALEYKNKQEISLDEQLFPLRAFMLNNIPTLTRLGIVIDHQVPISKLINHFKHEYQAWKCLNQIPKTSNEVASLVPRMVLRPNGDVFACPGYNYTHKIGNIQQHSWSEILRHANSDPILVIMFSKGLPGLYQYACTVDPTVARLSLSLSYSPCDVCQLLTKSIKTKL